MKDDQPKRRVIAVAPMPPEKSAYALARYSRSPDTIEDSIRWVHAHSSEKFWEQFYFAYGHASIADLGHAIVCFENISELAAIRLEDEPLWDGQAKSSRYQNFAPSGCYVPGTILGSETEGMYRGILGSLSNAYTVLHAPLKEFLSERTPRPESMKPGEYDRTIAARAFDVTRYLLPLAVRTNVGQVVSIRTLEKQMTRLLSAQLTELRAIGEDLKEACRKPPVNLWGELSGQAAGLEEPLAPTLARHAQPNAYQADVYSDLLRHAREVLKVAGLGADYRAAMDAVQSDIERLRASSQEAAVYAIPFGFKVRCLFKMDYAEAEYIARLRSGVKGHWSYRTVAWQMKQKMAERYPFLSGQIKATPPDEEDSLVR